MSQITLVNGKIDQTEGASEKCPNEVHKVYREQGRQVGRHRVEQERRQCEASSGLTRNDRSRLVYQAKMLAN
jgi:hypothetical protein